MKFLKKSLKILIITIFLSIFLITGLYLYARTIPKLDINNTGSYYLYDINDELFFQGNGTSKWANLNEISDYVKKATIVIEDKKILMTTFNSFKLNKPKYWYVFENSGNIMRFKHIMNLLLANPNQRVKLQNIEKFQKKIDELIKNFSPDN